MTSPTDELCEMIRQILSEALGTDLAADADFFAAGGDSLAAEEVLAALSERLAREVEGWMLLDHPSAQSLTAALAVSGAGLPR